MKRMWLRIVPFSVVVALAGCDSPEAGDKDPPVDGDLGQTFEKYATAKVDPGAARSLVLREGRMSLQTSDRTFDLELQENDLRGADYRAIDHVDGVESELAPEPITTYRGKLRDEPDSYVRLTLTDAKMEGYIVDGAGKQFFMEPASHFSKLAAADDFVIYEAAHIIPKDLSICIADDLDEAMNRDKDLVDPPQVSGAGLRVLSLATDADSFYVQTAGGASNANAEIRGILNMVDGIYEQELGISVEVAWQHTWTTPAPFAGQGAAEFLAGFAAYWNGANAQPRDAMQIWTAQSSPDLRGIGLAYSGTNQGPGVVCRLPTAAYGFVGDIVDQYGGRLVSDSYRIAAHELGHNLSAPHADAPPCTDTMMSTVSKIDGQVETFCQPSRDTITGYVAQHGTCLDAQPPLMGKRWPRADFDGDGKDDPTVFRPGDGTWYMARPNGTLAATQFGQAGDRLAAADFDGDKRTDHAVYRAGTWYVLPSATGTFYAVPFGLPDDIPAPADFDGDGKADVAVYRPSDGTWYILQSSQGGALRTAVFGASEDIPLPGDYDGDGKADVNVFRPSVAVWYRLNSVDGSFYAMQWGVTTDKPVVGDFDGDMKHDIAVYRPAEGAWYIRQSTTGTMSVVTWGLPEDLPVVANYDGDGKDDVAIFRPSTSTWAIVNSSNNTNTFLQFGSPGDIPSQTATH